MRGIGRFTVVVAAACSAGTTTTGTTHTDGTETTPPTGWDCAALPTGHLDQWPSPASANEDITFDAQGYLVGADGSNTLWRTDLDGNREIVLPQSGVNAGLRLMWWDGMLASAQYGSGAIFRIDPRNGSKELLVGGLALPSGIEIGDDHSVWFGELGGGRVQRYDADTGLVHVIAEGLGRPNGLTFNMAFDRLYVAATEESRIYAIDIDRVTKEPIGAPWVFVEGAGTGIDGLAVDACDNLYAGWWAAARIERYTPAGVGPEVLLDKPNADFALGNFAWGQARSGWDPTTVYAVEFGQATVRAIALGVGEKPRPEPITP